MNSRNGWLALGLFAVSGCSTINFEMPVNETSTMPREQWHHVWLFDLYEGSKPVNLAEACGQPSWHAVTTETSFANGLVELFTAPIWHPETVRVTCAAEAP